MGKHILCVFIGCLKFVWMLYLFVYFHLLRFVSHLTVYAVERNFVAYCSCRHTNQLLHRSFYF